MLAAQGSNDNPDADRNMQDVHPEEETAGTSDIGDESSHRKRGREEIEEENEERIETEVKRPKELTNEEKVQAFGVSNISYSLR